MNSARKPKIRVMDGKHIKEILTQFRNHEGKYVEVEIIWNSWSEHESYKLVMGLLTSLFGITGKSTDVVPNSY
ncbi:hypothetical protein E2C01_015409 [Portunus trituberculatus]|uniref:Uncharacterized protein n=1 Tax=Portunus trituberculatus TaxID=210409 RepID=A0A5B7DMH5_PORTR|nr:hypothetical protein [Portunus trituberculatus]